MSDIELFSEILSWWRQNGETSIGRISNDYFLDDEKNKKFKDLFESSSYGKNGLNQKWHQVVRFAINRENASQFMYDRLHELLLEHLGNNEDYFRIITEIATHADPSTLGDLNRLQILKDKFFKIFNSVINYYFNIYFY